MSSIFRSDPVYPRQMPPPYNPALQPAGGGFIPGVFRGTVHLQAAAIERYYELPPPQQVRQLTPTVMDTTVVSAPSQPPQTPVQCFYRNPPMHPANMRRPYAATLFLAQPAVQLPGSTVPAQAAALFREPSRPPIQLPAQPLAALIDDTIIMVGPDGAQTPIPTRDSGLHASQRQRPPGIAALLAAPPPPADVPFQHSLIVYPPRQIEVRTPIRPPTFFTLGTPVVPDNPPLHSLLVYPAAPLPPPILRIWRPAVPLLDSTAPTQPVIGALANLTDTTFDVPLTTPSTDSGPAGLLGYEVYVDSVLVSGFPILGAAFPYTVTGRSPGTLYSVTVKAVDKNWNRSVDSAAQTGTTTGTAGQFIRRRSRRFHWRR